MMFQVPDLLRWEHVFQHDDDMVLFLMLMNRLSEQQWHVQECLVALAAIVAIGDSLVIQNALSKLVVLVDLGSDCDLCFPRILADV